MPTDIRAANDFRPLRRHRIAHLWADRRGSVTILLALIFPMVLGGLALAAETGYWFMSQRKLQHAADVAAHAAGVRMLAGDDRPQLETAARRIALASGLSSTIGSLVINSPPLSGTQAGDVASIEVVLAEMHHRMFSLIFSREPVRVAARAVANTMGGSNGCILALAPTAASAVTVSGSTVVNLRNCDIASNSNASNSFAMSGLGSSLTVGCIYVVGNAVTNSGLRLTDCSNVKTQSPPIRDPYASVAEPASIGPCEDGKVGKPGKATTVTATYNHPSGVKSMRFCSGLDVKGIVTFSPGLYIVENDDLIFNGGNSGATSNVTIQGTSVTFFLRGGSRSRLDGTVHLALQAPTSGPLSGLLFFGSRTSAGTTQSITGDTTSTLKGAIYMPASQVTFIGNSTVTQGCTQVIGFTITFTGNSTLGVDCVGAGTKAIQTTRGVKLVE